MSIENSLPSRDPVRIEPTAQVWRNAIGSPAAVQYGANVQGGASTGASEAAVVNTAEAATPTTQEALNLGATTVEAATTASPVALSVAEQGRAAGLNITAPEGPAPTIANSQAGLAAVRHL